MKILLVLIALLATRATDFSLALRRDSVQVRKVVARGSAHYRDFVHHGPAVENQYMGLRLYFNGSGAIDVYSKTGRRGPELKQYLWYPTLQQQAGEDAGCDEYYVGGTVGLGGIRLWDGKTAIRLDTTGECVASAGNSANGSFAEIRYKGVPYCGGNVDISVRIDVRKGERCAVVTAKVLGDGKVQFVTGLNYFPDSKLFLGGSCVATWGAHPANVSQNPCPIGAAVLYNKEQVQKVEKEPDQFLIVSLPTKKFSINVLAASSKEDQLNDSVGFFRAVSSADSR